eukprot:jgi/Botrbrau1/5388/Bobra.0346s0048.2
MGWGVRSSTLGTALCRYPAMWRSWVLGAHLAQHPAGHVGSGVLLIRFHD